jgi:malonyl-CoA O-methyltransferase
VTPLRPSNAYARWAGTYDEENPVSTLDALALDFLSPPLSGLSLLDAGCGTARRLVFPAAGRPRRACGVDLVLAMLRAGRCHPERPRATAQADVRSLPCRAGAFDVVWSRLVAGHLPDLGPFYREVARVLTRGGRAVVTDFHPTAARAGHTRTFRDAAGEAGTAAHTIHEPARHEAAARESGLRFDARMDLGIGGEVRGFYETAGALDRFAAERGLPIVLAFRFSK